MLEQDFEKLLAAYFEEELDEAGLARLRDAVRQVPARRRRFQRELRLHTLMRETAMVMLAQEQSKRTNLIAVGWQHWRRITALAACLAVCGFSALLVWNYWNQPELIGRCVRVADSDEIVLWRQGRQRTAGPNTVLRVGDRIQTGCAAQTVLRVDGAGLLTLQGMNTVELCSPTNAMAVSIERGHVLIEATKRGPGMPPLTIRTPQSSVQVLGTVFGLEVEPTATRLRVFEGEVTFEETSLGRVVRVSDGQYSVTGTPNLEALDQDRRGGVIQPLGLQGGGHDGLEGHAQPAEVGRVLHLGAEADGAPEARRFSPGQGRHLGEGQHAVLAIVAGAVGA